MVRANNGDAASAASQTGLVEQLRRRQLNTNVTINEREGERFTVPPQGWGLIPSPQSGSRRSLVLDQMEPKLRRGSSARWPSVFC